MKVYNSLNISKSKWGWLQFACLHGISWAIYDLTVQTHSTRVELYTIKSYSIIARIRVIKSLKAGVRCTCQDKSIQNKLLTGQWSRLPVHVYILKPDDSTNFIHCTHRGSAHNSRTWHSNKIYTMYRFWQNCNNYPVSVFSCFLSFIKFMKSTFVKSSKFWKKSLHLATRFLSGVTQTSPGWGSIDVIRHYN